MTDLLPAVVRDSGPNPTWSVIWLHGLGADGHDFEPILPELVRPDWPAIRFIFPHAPMRPITINRGMSMRAWYDIRAMDIASRADETGVRQSMMQVDAWLAAETARGVPPERQFLAGFSQGGAIALALGVRRPQSLAGVIALSTYLPMPEQTAAEATPAGLATPVFMAHGVHDPVVAPTLGQASRDALTALGVAVAWHSYPVAHGVCGEEIRDLGDWLQPRLQAAG
jgi:phospholipase/carboxylesterase